jgi:hypothetical protein
MAGLDGRGMPRLRRSREACAPTRGEGDAVPAMSAGRRPHRVASSVRAPAERIWWSDAGVHQNITFPVHPDPVSGMHCWQQKVRVRPGLPDDRYVDIHVDFARAREVNPGGWRSRVLRAASCADRSGCSVRSSRPSRPTACRTTSAPRPRAPPPGASVRVPSSSSSTSTGHPRMYGGPESGSRPVARLSSRPSDPSPDRAIGSL